MVHCYVNCYNYSNLNRQQDSREVVGVGVGVELINIKGVDLDLEVEVVTVTVYSMVRSTGRRE